MRIFSQIGQALLNFLILPLVILAFNIFLVQPWFLGDGPANLGSIEVSYVSMAKFLVLNFPHLSWAPFWYLGFPFHLFYTPVLPVFTAALNAWGDFSFWQAYRILTGVGFILAPVSLFLLVLYITKSRMAALASGFLYSVMPTIFNFILPTGEIRADSFSQELWDSRRLVNLARWGEGPHIFSLIFLPLAGVFFLKAFKDRRLSSAVLAAFFIALTALTNAIGLYALALLLISIFLVEMFFDEAKRVANLLTTVSVAVFSYGLIAFWYNLSFIKTFFSEGGGVLGNWLNMLPWGIISLAVGVFIILFILQKIIKDKGASAVFLWTLGLFVIVAIYYFSAPPQLWQERIELAPQALRYVLEVDMGMAALVGILLALVGRKISAKNKLMGGVVGFSLACVVIGASLGYGFLYAPTGWKAIGTQVDLGQTAEKKMADFLVQKVDSQKGERVFLAGNYAFYLDYFSDVWQLRGGLYQAKTHPWPEHIYYQLRVGKDPEISEAWLKIINAKYVVVIPGGEYEQKEKFKVLPLLATLEDGSLIYEVPLVNTSPVKIVNLSRMNGLSVPKKGDDKEPILAYASWTEEIKNQTATFQKINNNLYKIRAQVGEGEGILVQMTADAGWRVSATSGKVTIKKDLLGFFVLVPSKSGEHEITLSHTRTGDVWLGYFITLATIIFAVWCSLLRRKSIEPHE